MRLLAVETSTLAGGVALLDGERLVAEYLLDVGIAHSERLMAAVDRVLSDARWTMRDLAGLAVAVGPGSFTGLRIAVSTVKGLALALGLPIAAVPTLDAMAAAVPWASLPVVAVLDARKGEVYAARYHWEDGAMRRDWEYAALAPEALALRLSEPTLLIEVPPHRHELMIRIRGKKFNLPEFGTGLHHLILMCAAFAVHRQRTERDVRPES